MDRTIKELKKEKNIIEKIIANKLHLFEKKYGVKITFTDYNGEISFKNVGKNKFKIDVEVR